jgi:hypothetical protein
MKRQPGYWGMHCFNGLSVDQQYRVVHTGNLPFGYEPEGECPNPAEVEVTTMYDLMPGPRFYCLSCVVEHLAALDPEGEWRQYQEPAPVEA